MRHIKLFEAFGTDDYYKEITHEEYDSLRDSFINIPKSESYKLESLISDDYNAEKQQVRNISYLLCRKKVRGGINPFTIVKLEDDWYLVYMEDQFFKCDQLEGLIKLLKDKGLTK